ncbi:hypothetical protein AAA799B03_01100, partial [Marine Group I thaumarchaeote SCGC AAA799-B03]
VELIKKFIDATPRMKRSAIVESLIRQYMESKN